jgi:hypothetical protein
MTKFFSDSSSQNYLALIALVVSLVALLTTVIQYVICHLLTSSYCVRKAYPELLLLAECQKSKKACALCSLLARQIHTYC